MATPQPPRAGAPALTSDYLLAAQRLNRILDALLTLGEPAWRRPLLDDALATLADLPDHAYRILAAAEEFLDELGPMAAPDCCDEASAEWTRSVPPGQPNG